MTTSESAGSGISSPLGRVTDLDGMLMHLQCAIELEHAAVPPYLCALYSLDPARNPAATELLLSVLMEEMLHVTLAANLLNAVGGRPEFDVPRMLPGYPRSLPHGDPSFHLSLWPYGDEALEQFMHFERPAPPGALPQDDGYETIAQFYGAIRRALPDLCSDLGEREVFRGTPARQVTDLAYGGSGRIVTVIDLASALEAVDEIVEQGEGASLNDVWDGDHEMFHPEREEVGHFYRMRELHLGRRYRRGDTPRSGPTGDIITVDLGGIAPMAPNPRRATGGDVRAHDAQHIFDRTYSQLLAMLDRAFDGHPQLLGDAIGLMYRLKSQAQALMQMPTGDGATTWGPTFEYVPPEDRL
ncbi:MAG: ferritin-like protein [Ilumatobacteraceae bacterium]